MQILFLVGNIQTLRAGYPPIWSEVSRAIKWAVLPLAPNEFQEVNKKGLVKCWEASILLGYDAASLNNRFPTFRKDLSVFSFFKDFFSPGLAGRGTSGRRERLSQRRDAISREKEALKKFQINSTLYSCIIRVHRRVSTCSHSVIFRTDTQKHVRDFLCYSYYLWRSVESILCFVDRAPCIIL
jgi:hypothetical protein